jgi:5-deoxy-glucuronate isomerase
LKIRMVNMGTIKTLASPELGSSVFLSLLILEFDGPGSETLQTDDREHVVNVLSGCCAVHIEPADGKKLTFDPVGRRKDIFGGKPELVYVPIHSRYEIVCQKAPFEAVIYTAPTDQAAPPAHVTPDQVRTLDSGKSDWQRQVHIAMGEDGAATCMMLGETESPPGNWSGFPPHRHTHDNLPQETSLEELYYFKFEPRSGFIIGSIYDDPAVKENARLKIFRHGQVFDAPEGYHFLAPCPGHRTRYTWALGGKTKKFGAWQDDPELAWLHNS